MMCPGKMRQGMFLEPVQNLFRIKGTSEIRIFVMSVRKYCAQIPQLMGDTIGLEHKTNATLAGSAEAI